MDAEAESAIAVSQYHANTDADEVDLALVEALLMYVCGEGVYKREGEDPKAAQGAVLVFSARQGFPCCLICQRPFPGEWLTCCNAGLPRSIAHLAITDTCISQLPAQMSWVTARLAGLECGVA